MLQYLIILLDDTSGSFCHYENPKTERRLMPIDMLRQGIRFAMMQNLMIQYVYPACALPVAHAEAIESMDHSKIKPTADGADVLVLNSLQMTERIHVPIVVRVGKQEIFDHEERIIDLMGRTPRLNIILTDIDTFTDQDFNTYRALLSRLTQAVSHVYTDSRSQQLNLLTDRMMLTQMNNCGAGDTHITLAPNGHFYVCPAFYYEDATDSVGDLAHGLDIKNRQLYQLDHAPICRHCDAWQCKRCVWMNRRTTLEVNTPGHEQCVVAHLERNASQELLMSIRTRGTFLPEQEMQTIDYLDPFEKRYEWQ